MSNQHRRSHYPFSLLSLSCIITFIIFLQGPLLAVAQLSQYELMMSPQYKSRSNSTTSTISNNDDAAYDGAPDIYDDNNEEFEDNPLSSSPSTSLSRPKLTSNVTLRLPALAEEVQKQDYEEEPDSYPHELTDDGTTVQDDSQRFPDKKATNPPKAKPDMFDSNVKQTYDLTSTSRIPFLPTNLWHDLFSKPGILVGIIGGVVIGMLSAILLVMFIIYRMRKKDEGSYALEEGPRKSPSHAYTRVSSREFFA